jgi:hypothetical protein
MPAIHPKILSTASEIAGEPTLAAIWFQTKPLAWYTQNPSGIGAISELLLMVASATYRCIFPKPRNDTETLMEHSGTLLCVRTTSELVFIASGDQNPTRELTHLSRRFSLSDLISCEYNKYPRSTDVNFQFNSSEQFRLHFVGDTNNLAGFISSATSHTDPSEIGG